MEITQEKIDRLNNRGSRFNVNIILNVDDSITIKKDDVEVFDGVLGNMRELRQEFRKIRNVNL